MEFYKKWFPAQKKIANEEKARESVLDQPEKGEEVLEKSMDVQPELKIVVEPEVAQVTNQEEVPA